MKVTVWLFLFGFISIAASAADKSEQPSDETIRSLIPGAWISREVLDNQPMTLAVEYRADGTLEAAVQMTDGRYRIKSILRGTWRVHNGFLTSRSESTGSEPRVTTYQVVAINETTLVLRDRDGEIVVRRRAHAD
jgi:hypothetical protein